MQFSGELPSACARWIYIKIKGRVVGVQWLILKFIIKALKDGPTRTRENETMDAVSCV